MEPPGSVALISAPGFSHGWAPLNVARIKAVLRERGHRVHTLCLCTSFSDYISRRHPDLKKVDENIGESGYAWHELHFSAVLFGHESPRGLIRRAAIDCDLSRDVYYTQLCPEDERASAADMRRVRERTSQAERYCRLMEEYIGRRLNEVDWEAVDVAGFSCVEAQFLTSVFIARELKRRRPGLPIVFGGPHFQEYNAAAIARCFPEIDLVIVGEGQEALDRILRAGEKRRAIAEAGRVVINLAAPYSADRIGSGRARVAPLPPPDYDHLSASELGEQSLTVNIAKGCSHWRCSFCGIVERGQQVRPAREVFDELAHLVRRYGTTDINFGDWEINGDAEQLELLCDLLIAAGIRLRAWGEINARNTSPRLLRKMRRAGISSVQIGIESFSARALKRIRKPATILDNVKTLKWSVEAGMERLIFNLLVNHPGAGAGEAEETLRTLKLIAHLIRPPIQCVPMDAEIYRTSALFDDAASFGIEGVRDYDFYRRCYPPGPLAEELPMFHLQYRLPPLDPIWYEVERLVGEFRRQPVSCTARFVNGEARIYDSRRSPKSRYRLAGIEADVLRRVSGRILGADALAAETGRSVEEIAASVDRLAGLDLVLRERGRILGLPVVRGAAPSRSDGGE